MSAVSVVRADGAIVIAADGVTYGPDGVVVGFGSKVLTIPSLNCAVANVGEGNFRVAFMDQLGLRFQSFDHLAEHFVELCYGAFLLCANQPRDWLPSVTAVLAGWSDERQQFEAFKVHSREKEQVNTETGELSVVKPWTLHTMPPIWASSSPGPETMAEFGIIPDTEMSALDYAARLVCANRAHSGAGEMDEATGLQGYGVGGFLELTLIQREKITSWIAHRWPDAVGTVIDPQAGEPMPSFPLVIP